MTFVSLARPVPATQLTDAERQDLTKMWEHFNLDSSEGLALRDEFLRTGKVALPKHWQRGNNKLETGEPSILFPLRVVA